jgi:hypothetical protein
MIWAAVVERKVRDSCAVASWSLQWRDDRFPRWALPKRLCLGADWVQEDYAGFVGSDDGDHLYTLLRPEYRSFAGGTDMSRDSLGCVPDSYHSLCS